VFIGVHRWLKIPFDGTGDQPGWPPNGKDEKANSFFQPPMNTDKGMIKKKRMGLHGRSLFRIIAE